MGWASGSEIMDALIKSAKKNIRDKAARKRFYQDAINAFEDRDWDTQSECEGQDKAFDEVLVELHPEWYEAGDGEEEPG